jgi:aquaporin Z
MTPARAPWAVYLAELVGTALLLLVGLSLVILAFGTGAPGARLLPDPAARRLLVGFLFGATGAALAWSRVGKVSGAHLNPVVTLAFRLKGLLAPRDAAGYAAAQCLGAVLGSAPLLLWGGWGRSVAYACTVPGPGWTPFEALLGETAATAAMIALLFAFLGRRRWRPYTPLLFPPLYALLVWLEAPLSGTSTNPARSLGPAVIAGVWRGWWIYLVGPLAGTLLGLAVHRLPGLREFEAEVAKLYHFELDAHGIFRAGRGDSPPTGADKR